MTHALTHILHEDLSYNEAGKRRFHKLAKNTLIGLAHRMGLTQGEYRISINPGGIALSGEVTLTTPELYIQISKPLSPSLPPVQYRRIQDAFSHAGGMNHYMDVETMLSEQGIDKLMQVAGVALQAS